MQPSCSSTRSRGTAQEVNALQWLVSRNQHYSILFRNWRLASWAAPELDAVLWDSKTLEIVFVEIKSAQTESLPGGAIGKLDFKKRESVSRAARLFLERGFEGGAPWVTEAKGARLDVIFQENGEWVHIPNAWQL